MLSRDCLVANRRSSNYPIIECAEQPQIPDHYGSCIDTNLMYGEAKSDWLDIIHAFTHGYRVCSLGC